jgi:hypothetical protein
MRLAFALDRYQPGEVNNVQAMILDACHELAPVVKRLSQRGQATDERAVTESLGHLRKAIKQLASLTPHSKE